MTQNILIGVGGTGAKAVEAALVLLAAGIGGGTVHVGLVDQDGANGNVERTRNLLSRLCDFRTLWSRPNAPNRIDWTPKAAPGIGSVDVRPLFDKPEPSALWSPTRTENSLKEIVGQNLSPDRRHLFNLLFMEGPEEQELPLAQGYRGRAHVGATALVASLADDDDPLLIRLRELMAPAGGGPVNLFIVGSAFGGTGAAGFPTLARKLNRIRNEPGFPNHGNVSIGGLLLLPYFSFDDPDEETEAVVTSDELMPKAQLALEYYENLFQHERTFDRFYLLGWDPILPLGYHEPGSREQANPALPPELLAATAAVDFFGRTGVGGEEEAAGDVARMVSGRQERVLKWRDLPPEDYQQRLGQLLRFAAYWRYLFEPQLAKPDRIMFRNWARTLAQGRDPDEFENELNALRGLLDAILHWAATIEETGGPTVWGGGIWSVKGLLDGAHEPTPTRPVALVDSLDEQRLLDTFDRMIRFDTEEAVTRAGGSLYGELSAAVAPPGEHVGLGRALAAVYSASRIK
jgi:hypothetical protein